MDNKKDTELRLANWVDQKFKEAMVAKGELVKDWQTYMDAYNNVFANNVSKPEYKSDSISNYIFSTVETIRPIMLDNDPQWQVLARLPESQEKTDAVDFMLRCEFNREHIRKKIGTELINTLTMGTSVFYTRWNSDLDKSEVVPISIFNFFPDPLATCIDDAELLMYADYLHVNMLKGMFPEHKERLSGSSINYAELAKNDMNEVKVNNQVLVVEAWVYDWTSIDVEEDYDGDKLKKPIKGIRQIICAPELGLILSDEQNPYNDNKMPFDLLKCYDVPNNFWGDGEVKRLMSPQTQMNELNNAIVDNAKSTANMPWIVDKNAGIPKGKITNRPGLVIRKNPGSEVRRDQPPSMPAYVQNVVDNCKLDIEQISGVNDSLKGNNEKGVYTAQGILSLQEASQSRIRIKTTDLELVLGGIGLKIFNRNKQFWNEGKYVSMFGENGKQVFKLIDKDVFDYEYDIQVKAGSTAPLNKSAMFDLMIRLAQTPAEDGLPMVDRTAVLQYMPGFDAKTILGRMTGIVEAQKKDQINEQEHVANHDETQAILKQLTEQIQAMNTELAELGNKVAKEDDEGKLEQIREQSYNEGYEDSLSSIEPEQESGQEQSPNQGLPDEVLQMIGELSDEELISLMEQRPDLKEIISQELQYSQNQGTPTQGGLQGGMI